MNARKERENHQGACAAGNRVGMRWPRGSFLKADPGRVRLNDQYDKEEYKLPRKRGDLITSGTMPVILCYLRWIDLANNKRQKFSIPSNFP
jgi:hypothetical protein